MNDLLISELKSKYEHLAGLDMKEYKDIVKTEVFCLPFEAFPIKGMNYEGTNFGA